MDLKGRISTPLEAGPSILDAHRLPSFLTPALEYASQRLADKGLHTTLVVARRDYQLPDCFEKNSMTISTDAPVTTLPSPPFSPSSPDVVACAPSFTAIKSLVRSGSQHTLRSIDKPDVKQPQRSKSRSLSKNPSLASLFDGGLVSPRLRWSHAPNTPSCLPRTPKTPATPASSVTTPCSSTASGGSIEAPGGIRLIYTTPLAPRAYKLVTATLARAARKFNLGTPLVAHEPSTYNIPPPVLHGSILQNDVLHSSEGLTLLSLDHLYTFKAALIRYAATRSGPGSHFRLEDAVDELRRYVLSAAGGRWRLLLKSTLVQAYDWLGPVNDSALGEVMTMYSRAYGGATEMGVQDDLVKANPAPAVAAAMALPKVVDADAELRLGTPTPAARMSGQSAATTAATVSPPASPEGPGTVSSATTASTPASLQSQQLSTPMSGQNWVVEDYSPWADEGMVNIPDTPPVRSAMLTPVMNHRVDTPAEELNVIIEGDFAGDESPVAPEEATQGPKTPTSPIPNIPHAAPDLPASPHKISSPRVSSRGSPPSLRVQTSFPTTPKPKSTPRRRKTPLPREPLLSQQKALADPTVRPSPVGKEDIRIEITIPDDDDGGGGGRGGGGGDLSDGESVRTEFEDAELTAQSPAKTPGGSFWLGIDEILGSAERRPSPGGALRHHRRRSSSLSEAQTPGGERLGPTTPNGYDDISPTTRGEWGFLMVSDPFKTKTAAVSCV